MLESCSVTDILYDRHHNYNELHEWAEYWLQITYQRISSILCFNYNVTIPTKYANRIQLWIHCKRHWLNIKNTTHIALAKIGNGTPACRAHTHTHTYIQARAQVKRTPEFAPLHITNLFRIFTTRSMVYGLYDMLDTHDLQKSFS